MQQPTTNHEAISHSGCKRLSGFVSSEPEIYHTTTMDLQEPCIAASGWPCLRLCLLLHHDQYAAMWHILKRCTTLLIESDAAAIISVRSQK